MSDWSVFDKIYCIHYLPYKDRFQNIKDELKRVGILDSPNFEFYYTVDSKIYDDLYRSLIDHRVIFENDIDDIKNNVATFGNFKNSRVFNLAINKFNLLKICREFEYRKVLILEDDIVFLKNLKKIEQYIQNIPDDFDILNFDYWVKTRIDGFERIKKHQVNDFYYENVSNELLVNFSCMALSDYGIKSIVQNQENFFKSSDFYINNYNTFPGGNIRIFIPKKNLCVQSDLYVNSNNNNSFTSNSRNQSVIWTYQQIGLDLTDYQTY